VTHIYNPTWEAEIKASWGKWFSRPYLEKNHHKKGLVVWLKV
jgi:hypothetical protein